MNPSPIISIGMTIEIVNKMLTLYTLDYNRGNKTVTANMLGISVRTLDNWLEIYENDVKIQKDNEEKDARERAEYLDRARGITRSQPAQTGFIPGSASLYASAPGLNLESAPEPATQYSVPMPERQEIQNMLPKPNGRGRPRKNGRAI